jgi:hypothetical protein
MGVLVTWHMESALGVLASGILFAGVPAVPSVSAAAPATLAYACEPPAPAAPENCAQWHTTPVTLHWLFDPSALIVLPGTDCAAGTDRLFTTDTPQLDLTCSVTSILTGTLTKTATVRVDQTPPAVTGAVPERPPDHNGWYNHAVAFTFTGADATSGISSCDSTVYVGPDAADGNLAGACRDVAGNEGAGSVPLKYDATPPTVTLVPQESRNGEVNLRWSASPDSVTYSVTREPGHDGPQPSTVYSGPNTSYTDQNVAEAQTYQYTITSSDAAANSSSVVVIAIPGGSQMLLGARETLKRPKAVRRPIAGPRLRWRRVRHADYYNVQVYRGHRKVLSAWPAGNRLQLRPSWHFRGKRFRLTPDRYHWYVWPGFGNRRAHRYGRMIAHRTFVVRQG